ncbi:unnamed protein product, partial [Brachionus calyciflorus]
MLSNETFNSTQLSMSISYSLCFSGLLILIFVLNFIFNMLSISSVLNTKPFTTISLLILNLSIADIIYSIGIPFFIIQILNHKLPFESFGCKLFLMTEFLGIIVGLFTVTALSVERFFDVADKKKRFNNYSNKYKLFIIGIYLIFTWLFAFFFTLPFVSSVYLQKFGSNYSCQTSWSDTSMKIYFITIFFIIFLTPYLIIIISSVKLLIFLNEWKQRLKRNSEVVNLTTRRSLFSFNERNSTFLYNISWTFLTHYHSADSKSSPSNDLLTNEHDKLHPSPRIPIKRK